jgi:hypothetical protein
MAAAQSVDHEALLRASSSELANLRLIYARPRAAITLPQIRRNETS